VIYSLKLLLSFSTVKSTLVIIGTDIEDSGSSSCILESVNIEPGQLQDRSFHGVTLCLSSRLSSV
jgi:hypothetical protein